LGNRCCPGFPTGNASPGQKGVPFCPGSSNRDKRGPFVPVGNTNRDKRCSQRPRMNSIRYSIIVEFAFWIEDLLNNKSEELFLNRHNVFFRYEFIAHLPDLWKKGIINFD